MKVILCRVIFLADCNYFSRICGKILIQGIYRKLSGIYDTPERENRYFSERGINLSWFDVPLGKNTNHQEAKN